MTCCTLKPKRHRHPKSSPQAPYTTRVLELLIADQGLSLAAVKTRLEAEGYSVKPGSLMTTYSNTLKTLQAARAAWFPHYTFHLCKTHALFDWHADRIRDEIAAGHPQRCQ